MSTSSSTSPAMARISTPKAELLRQRIQKFKAAKPLTPPSSGSSCTIREGSPSPDDPTSHIRGGTPSFVPHIERSPEQEPDEDSYEDRSYLRLATPTMGGQEDGYLNHRPGVQEGRTLDLGEADYLENYQHGALYPCNPYSDISSDEEPYNNICGGTNDRSFSGLDSAPSSPHHQAPSAHAPHLFHVGDKVMVLPPDEIWYNGTIIVIDEQEFGYAPVFSVQIPDHGNMVFEFDCEHIRFPDSEQVVEDDEAGVSIEQAHSPLSNHSHHDSPAPPECLIESSDQTYPFHVGDLVMGRWQAGDFYKAQITAINPSRRGHIFTVKFLDYDGSNMRNNLHLYDMEAFVELIAEQGLDQPSHEQSYSPPHAPQTYLNEPDETPAPLFPQLDLDGRVREELGEDLYQAFVEDAHAPLITTLGGLHDYDNAPAPAPPPRGLKRRADDASDMSFSSENLRGLTNQSFSPVELERTQRPVKRLRQRPRPPNSPGEVPLFDEAAYNAAYHELQENAVRHDDFLRPEPRLTLHTDAVDDLTVADLFATIEYLHNENDIIREHVDHILHGDNYYLPRHEFEAYKLSNQAMFDELWEENRLLKEQLGRVVRRQDYQVQFSDREVAVMDYEYYQL